MTYRFTHQSYNHPSWMPVYLSQTHLNRINNAAHFTNDHPPKIVDNPLSEIELLSIWRLNFMTREIFFRFFGITTSVWDLSCFNLYQMMFNTSCECHHPMATKFQINPICLSPPGAGDGHMARLLISHLVSTICARLSLLTPGWPHITSHQMLVDQNIFRNWKTRR